MSFSAIDVDSIRVDNKVILKDGTSGTTQALTTLPVSASLILTAVLCAPAGHGVLIKLVHAGGKPLTFQTPLMNLAWTVQVRTQEKSSTCNLPLSFGTTNSNVLEFKNFLTSLRNKVKAMIVENVVDWYGKTLTDEQIDEYLAPIVKEPQPDSTYSPSFLPKIAHSTLNDGSHTIDVKCFGIDKKEITAGENLRQGARVGAIVNIPYLHLGRGNKMMSIRADVTQCLVLPIQNDTSFGFDMSLDEDVQAVAREHENEAKKRKMDDAVSADETTNGKSVEPGDGKKSLEPATNGISKKKSAESTNGKNKSVNGNFEAFDAGSKIEM